MKEREIITVGRPSIKALSKNEAKVFYSTLLSAIIDYYKEENKDNFGRIEKNKSQSED